VNFLHERTSINPEGKGGGGLLLDPGLGKTSICLEWMQQMRMFGLASRFLIVAPLRPVYQVWPAEILGWSNFRDLSYSIVHGTPEVRRKRLALPANVHIINRDALVWLSRQVMGRERLPWQAIIIDESTGFKNWSSNRTKALRSLIPRIPYRHILTGSPTPKNLADLYPQIWMLDEGEALGKNITTFREQYCMRIGRREENNYQVREDRATQVKDAIQHLVLRLDAKDWLSMPPVVYHNVNIELPSAAQRDYDAMEKDMFLALADGTGREAVNAAAKYQACKQISNGGLYNGEGLTRTAHDIHSAKTDACLEIIEELNGKPVLIAYQYEHDVQRLQRQIKGLHIIRGGMNPKKVSQIIDAWNSDTLNPPYLAVQPQALSYGVNMQHGSCRDIIWYGPTDSLDIYIQFNARIYRQGVGSGVRVHRLCCVDTVDELIWTRTDAKDDVQSNLLQTLREYAQKKHHKRSA
jgi:SNF2 family DNA or RNA helicase